MLARCVATCCICCCFTRLTVGLGRWEAPVRLLTIPICAGALGRSLWSDSLFALRMAL